MVFENSILSFENIRGKLDAFEIPFVTSSFFKGKNQQRSMAHSALSAVAILGERDLKDESST